jgi:hypothetical protein
VGFAEVLLLCGNNPERGGYTKLRKERKEQGLKKGKIIIL